MSDLRTADTAPGTWVRNAGPGVYHCARPDYIRSGMTLCGAHVPHPAFRTMPGTFGGSLRRPACRRCERLHLEATS